MLYIFDFENTLAVRTTTSREIDTFDECVRSKHNPYEAYAVSESIRNLIKQLRKLNNTDKFLILTESSSVCNRYIMDFAVEHYPWVDWEIINTACDEEKVALIMHYIRALGLEPNQVYIMDDNERVVNLARNVGFLGCNTLEFLVTKDTNLPMFGARSFSSSTNSLGEVIL